MSQQDSIQRLLESRLIICSGSGGVGKTTISATLAVQAARRGLKVLVLTIDPARRLADSLGIGPLGNQEVQIPPERLAAMGVPPGGELWALMLDAKSTFDGLIERFAPTRELKERILNNRYYQQISRSMVGSQEYMAMEHLLSAHEKGAYDLVVLDTPPSRHALDFLDAPSRIRGVLEEGVLNWLLRPSSFLFNRMQKRLADQEEKGGFLKNIERVIGLSMIHDLSEFVVLFKDMLGDFKLRALGTQQLLADPNTCFVLITSPNEMAIREAGYFLEQLKKHGLHLGGFIINRVFPLAILHPASPELEAIQALSPEDWRAQFPRAPLEPLSDDQYHQLLAKLRECLKTLPKLAELDRENLDWLRSQVDDSHLFVQLPELPYDIHDLEGLGMLGQLLQEFEGRSSGDP